MSLYKCNLLFTQDLEQPPIVFQRKEPFWSDDEVGNVPALELVLHPARPLDDGYRAVAFNSQMLSEIQENGLSASGASRINGV